jgi:hypothetical protein
MKIYAIREIHWEYNDENYYTTDHDAGHTCKAAKNKEAADKECLKLNLAALKQAMTGDRWGLREYCYDLDDIARNVGKMEQAIKEAGGQYSGDRVTVPDTVTDLQLQRILNSIHLRWFKVDEVEVMDG